jgi:hypothetical protein
MSQGSFHGSFHGTFQDIHTVSSHIEISFYDVRYLMHGPGIRSIGYTVMSHKHNPVRSIRQINVFDFNINFYPQ